MQASGKKSTAAAATAKAAATANAAVTGQDREGINRSRHINLAAGILMLWIITFHAVNGSKVFGEVNARVAIPFLTFSMPWYFYKSGSFFTPGHGGNYTGRNRHAVNHTDGGSIPNRPGHGGNGIDRDIKKLD